MNLTELLQRLSEIEPAVCRYDPAYRCYLIGEYKFLKDLEQGELWAEFLGIAVGGPPALDWLRGAVERAIEARGWTVNIAISTGLDYSQRYTVYISNLGVIGRDKSQTSLTDALLAAFVAACEAAAAPANR